MTDLFDHADASVRAANRRATREFVERYHTRLAAAAATTKTGPCFACMLAACAGCAHDASAPCAADPSHHRGYRFLADDGSAGGDGTVCAKCFWSGLR